MKNFCIYVQNKVQDDENQKE